MDLVVEALQTDLQSLLSLLPDRYAQPLETYKSSGDVVFLAQISGPLGEPKPPKLTVTFSGNEVALYHPDYRPSACSKISMG